MEIIVVSVKLRLRARSGAGELFIDFGFYFQAVRVVVLDEIVGGVQDTLLAAIVFIQNHNARAAPSFFEAENVFDRRPAKLIDGLVVVANHGNVLARRLGAEEYFNKLVLRGIGILKLINQTVPKLMLVFF